MANGKRGSDGGGSLVLRRAEASMSDARFIRARAEAGDADAQNGLGSCYAEGDGVKRDLRAAVRWFRAAAAQGNELAHFNLGLAHAHGWGGAARSLRKAAAYYQEAGKKGHVGAWVNLADLYMRGAGVARDPARAVHWWTRAAKNGAADACACLGRCYGEGRGVKRDMVRARAWLRKAIRYGDHRAFALLARLVIRRPGRWFTPAEAYLWLHAARQLGHREVRPAHLRMWASRLTSARIDALQARARRYFDGLGIEILNPQRGRCGRPGGRSDARD